MKTAEFTPRFPITDARAKLDGPAQNMIQCTKGGDTMPAASKKNAYNMKYDKENMRQIKFNLSLKYDQDVIAALDAVPNKQGYIKDLIRADIARAKSETEATGPAQKEEEQTMKRWYIIRESVHAAGQVFETPIDAADQADAIETARAKFSMLSKHDQDACEDFYVGFAALDEDGCIDYDSMTDVYSIKSETLSKTLYKGYDPDGRRVEIVLDDDHIWIVDAETGDRDQYNDEWYSEDDTASLAAVKASMISEGYRL